MAITRRKWSPTRKDFKESQIRSAIPKKTIGDLIDTHYSKDSSYFLKHKDVAATSDDSLSDLLKYGALGRVDNIRPEYNGKVSRYNTLEYRYDVQSEYSDEVFTKYPEIFKIVERDFSSLSEYLEGMVTVVQLKAEKEIDFKVRLIKSTFDSTGVSSQADTNRKLLKDLGVPVDDSILKLSSNRETGYNTEMDYLEGVEYLPIDLFVINNILVGLGTDQQNMFISKLLQKLVINPEYNNIISGIVSQKLQDIKSTSAVTLNNLSDDFRGKVIYKKVKMSIDSINYLRYNQPYYVPYLKDLGLSSVDIILDESICPEFCCNIMSTLRTKKVVLRLHTMNMDINSDMGKVIYSKDNISTDEIKKVTGKYLKSYIKDNVNISSLTKPNIPYLHLYHFTRILSDLINICMCRLMCLKESKPLGYLLEGNMFYNLRYNNVLPVNIMTDRLETYISTSILDNIFYSRVGLYNTNKSIKMSELEIEDIANGYLSGVTSESFSPYKCFATNNKKKDEGYTETAPDIGLAHYTKLLDGIRKYSDSYLFNIKRELARVNNLGSLGLAGLNSLEDLNTIYYNTQKVLIELLDDSLELLERVTRVIKTPESGEFTRFFREFDMGSIVDTHEEEKTEVILPDINTIVFKILKKKV